MQDTYTRVTCMEHEAVTLSECHYSSIGLEIIQVKQTNLFSESEYDESRGSWILFHLDEYTAKNG